MTKTTNIIIVALIIALITTFIVSAVAMQSKTDKTLSTYTARREELSAQQQQIQSMIISLNSTLQSEVEKQKIVSDKLGVKSNYTAAAPVITEPTPAVVQPTPVVTTPTPTRRVTRAS